MYTMSGIKTMLGFLVSFLYDDAMILFVFEVTFTSGLKFTLLTLIILLLSLILNDNNTINFNVSLILNLIVGKEKIHTTENSEHL